MRYRRTGPEVPGVKLSGSDVARAIKALRGRDTHFFRWGPMAATTARDLEELFNVIRLLSAEDVEVLAALFDTAPTRLDIVFACLAKDANRMALHEYLYAECTTPVNKAVVPAVPSAPRPERPRAMRRLTLGARELVLED